MKVLLLALAFILFVVLALALPPLWALMFLYPAALTLGAIWKEAHHGNPR